MCVRVRLAPHVQRSNGGDHRDVAIDGYGSIVHVVGLERPTELDGGDAVFSVARHCGQCDLTFISTIYICYITSAHKALTNSHIVAAANSFVRTNALFAIALRQMRQIIVVGAEHPSGRIVVGDHHVGLDHLRSPVRSGDAKRHVLVFAHATNQLDLQHLALDLPLDLQPIGEQIATVVVRRLGRCGRLVMGGTKGFALRRYIG